AVEIGDDGIGERDLDYARVLRARAAAGPWRGEHGPVEAAAAPARPVAVEDERDLVEAGVAAAVVDVADHDQLGNAVAIDVGDDGGAHAEGGPMLDAAVGVAPQVRGLVDVDPHLAPESPRGEETVHGELVAVSVEAHHVVRAAGAEDLLETVAIHVGHGDVLVVHAAAEARLAVATRRPAGTNAAIGLEDGDLARLRPRPVGIGPTHDDVASAVVVEIGHGEGASLADTEGVPCPDDAAETVVDGELVAGAADDHLRRAVTRQIGDGDVCPDAVAARGAPLEATVVASQRHDITARAPDDVWLAVAVEVRDGGRRVPANQAARAPRWGRRAAAVLPLQDGRAHDARAEGRGDRPRRAHRHRAGRARDRIAAAPATEAGAGGRPCGESRPGAAIV